MPTLEEAAIEGVDIGTWFGVLAPAAQQIRSETEKFGRLVKEAKVTIE